MPIVKKDNKPLSPTTTPRRYGLIFISSALLILGAPWWARQNRDILGEDLADAQAAVIERQTAVNGGPGGFSNELLPTTNIVTYTNYYVKVKLELGETNKIDAIFPNGQKSATWTYKTGFSSPNNKIYITNKRVVPTNQTASTTLTISGNGLTSLQVPITVHEAGKAEDSVPAGAMPIDSLEFWAQYEQVHMSYYSKRFTLPVQLSGWPGLYPKSQLEALDYTVEITTNITYNKNHYLSAKRELETVIDIFDNMRYCAFDNWVDDFEFRKSAVPNFGSRTYIFTNEVSYLPDGLGEHVGSHNTTNVKTWAVKTEASNIVADLTYVTYNTVVSNYLTIPFNLYPQIWEKMPVNLTSKENQESYTITNDGIYWAPSLWTPFKNGGAEGVLKVEDGDIPKVFDARGNFWSTLPGEMGEGTNAFVYPSFEVISNSITDVWKFTWDEEGIKSNLVTETNHYVLHNSHITTNTLTELKFLAEKLNATVFWAGLAGDSNTIITKKSIRLDMRDGAIPNWETKEALLGDYTKPVTNTTIATNNFGILYGSFVIFSEVGIYGGGSGTGIRTTTVRRTNPTETETFTLDMGDSMWSFDDNPEVRVTHIKDLQLNKPSIFAITNGYVEEVWIYAVITPNLVLPLISCRDSDDSYSEIYENPDGAPAPYHEIDVSDIETAIPDPLPLANYAGNVGGVNWHYCTYPIPSGFTRDADRADEYAAEHLDKVRINEILHVVNPSGPIRFDFGIQDALPDLESGYRTVGYILDYNKTDMNDCSQISTDPDPERWECVDIEEEYSETTEYYEKNISFSVSFVVLVKWKWKHMNSNNIYDFSFEADWYKNNTNFP